MARMIHGTYDQTADFEAEAFADYKAKWLEGYWANPHNPVGEAENYFEMHLKQLELIRIVREEIKGLQSSN